MKTYRDPRRVAPEVEKSIIAMVKEGCSYRQVAESVGVSVSTVSKVYAKQGEEAEGADEAPFSLAAVPSEERSLAELKAAMRASSQRRLRAARARRWRKVTVKIDGPFCLAALGDPHVDDPGCDFEALEADVSLLQKHRDIACAINMGDLNNNWVGRLARLYSKSEVTAREGWVLVEWLVNAVPWLAVIIGNHDLMHGDHMMAKALAENPGSFSEWEAQLELVPPRGASVRVHASHNFPGNSQWNKQHGLMKAAQMSGAQADIYLAGHLHCGGYAVDEHKATNRIYVVARCSGYKAIDDYAKVNGYGSSEHFRSVAVVVNPLAEGAARVQPFGCLESALSFTRFLRKRA